MNWLDRIPALAGGALLAVSFVLPGSAAWGLLALSVLGLRAVRLDSSLAALRMGWLFGLAWFGLGLSWLFVSIHTHGGIGAATSAGLVLLFAACMAIFPALALCAARVAAVKDWVFLMVAYPAAWGVSEWLRGTVLTGFPWIHVGLTQVDSPVSGFAPVVGAYGTCGLTVLAAGCIAGIVAGAKNRHWVSCACAAIILAAVMAGGSAAGRIPWSEVQDRIAVRLVQTDMPQMDKFGAAGVADALVRSGRLLDAPWTTDRSVPRLAVLPETVFPIVWSHMPMDAREAFAEKSREAGAWLILGAFGQTRSGYQNQALCISPKGTESTYQKRHLVPFGEFVPPGFRWLVDAMRIPLPDQLGGSAYQQLMSVAGNRVGISLCYEDLFLEESRDYWSLGQSPSMIVNLSNLAWFGRSWALPQHLLASRLLAIATARPVVRSTNTGVTAVIDADGRVLAQAPAHEETVVEAFVDTRMGEATPFVRWGNLPWVLAMLLVLSACFMGRRRVSIWED